jgi:hypothetical protein
MTKIVAPADVGHPSVCRLADRRSQDSLGCMLIYALEILALCLRLNFGSDPLPLSGRGQQSRTSDLYEVLATNLLLQ